VIDLIAALRKRYSSSEATDEQTSAELTEDGFIGMWKDREDMEDSTAWVRYTRQREWVK